MRSFDSSFFSAPVVVFDTETTGTGRGDRLVEFAAIRFEKGKEPKSIAFLINPQIPVPYFAERIHGINDGMLASAPSFQNVWSDIAAIFAGALVFAHNFPFDRRMLQQDAARIGKTITLQGVCTLKISRAIHPERRGRGAHTLEGLARMYGIPNDTAHRALSDAQTTAHLLAFFAEQEPVIVRSHLPR